MSNKKLFKEMYSKRINKDKNFEEIISSINNNSNNSFKWILAPVCFILVISVSIMIENNNLTFNNYPNNEIHNNTNCETDDNLTNSIEYEKRININQINSFLESALHTNITYEDTNINEIYKEYCFLNNIEFKDFEISKFQKILDKNKYLINYKLELLNQDKRIIISFSKDNEPIRNYYFLSENNDKSIINNHEVKIYQYEKKYFVLFVYNNINFDIETENIDWLELKQLINLIIL